MKIWAVTASDAHATERMSNSKQYLGKQFSTSPTRWQQKLIHGRSKYQETYFIRFSVMVVISHGDSSYGCPSIFSFDLKVVDQKRRSFSKWRPQRFMTSRVDIKGRGYSKYSSVNANIRTVESRGNCTWIFQDRFAFHRYEDSSNAAIR